MRNALSTKKRSTPKAPAVTRPSSAPATDALTVTAEWCTKTARNAKNLRPSSSGR